MTVRIYLSHPPSSTTSDQVPEREEPAPKGHETILIAEDDPFVRSSVILRVQALGYSVVASVNGTDALQTLRSNRDLELLFTDSVMTGGLGRCGLAVTS